MRANYIAFAVPFFFLLIGIELAVARAKGRSLYRTGDAIGDLGCGIFQQVMLLFLASATIALYTWLYEHVRLVTWSSPGVPLLIAFVGVDFLYYWWHRLSHEVGFLWAAHVVHHQSEDYNLAVALRQAILTSFTIEPFFAPLAIAGVPPLVFASVYSLNTLYQFWIHTELVGRLGWLETWLNTPSHHRVHHAINPRYLDKNYGAVLIVWDRLFGTFIAEDERPVYGIVKPLASYNPLWAQIEPVIALFRASASAPRFIDKLRVLVASPAWTPEGVAPYPGVDDGSYVARPKYDPTARRSLQLYTMAQLGTAVVVTTALMFTKDTIARSVLAIGAALVVLTLASLSGLLEAKRWALPLELARLVLAAIAAIALIRDAGLAAPLAGTAVLAALASGVWVILATRAAPHAAAPQAERVAASAFDR